jgi:hypothetical protein
VEDDEAGALLSQRQHDVVVGGVSYRLVANEREGQWTAHAERAAGDRFGLEVAAASEAEAVSRLRAWLEWQHDHTTALAALQEAEHDFHRVVAGSAFANPTEGPTPDEMQKAALNRVEAARVHLDEVRSRRPEP